LVPTRLSRIVPSGDNEYLIVGYENIDIDRGMDIAVIKLRD